MHIELGATFVPLPINDTGKRINPWSHTNHHVCHNTHCPFYGVRTNKAVRMGYAGESHVARDEYLEAN